MTDVLARNTKHFPRLRERLVQHQALTAVDLVEGRSKKFRWYYNDESVVLRFDRAAIDNLAGQDQVRSLLADARGQMVAAFDQIAARIAGTLPTEATAVALDGRFPSPEHLILQPEDAFYAVRMKVAYAFDYGPPADEITYQDHQRGACEDEVRNSLLLGETARDTADAVARTFVEMTKTIYVPKMPAIENVCYSVVPQHGWAIRKSDLDLVNTFMSSAPIAAVLSTQSVSASLIAGIVALAYKIYSKVKSKGAQLDPIKVAILVSLQQVNGGRGASPSDISKHLALSLSAADALIELKELESVTVGDGSRIPLAFQSSLTGLWHTDC